MILKGQEMNERVIATTKFETLSVLLIIDFV